MKLPVLDPIHKPWLLLWGIPVFSVLLVIVASQMSLPVVEAMIISPFGFSENIPIAFLLFGVVYAAAIVRLPAAKHLRAWMLLYIVALIFFAGEDQNWFQYWIGAEVPDYFMTYNKEHEINLHNINSWFNQKPRLMVEMWTLIACILVPLGWWAWPKKATAKFIPAELWPDRRIVPLAVISIGLGLLGRSQKHLARVMDLPDFSLSTSARGLMQEAFPGVRISELQEVCFAYLMALFVILLYGHLASAPTKKADRRAKSSK